MIIAQKKKKHKFSSVVGSKRKVLEIPNQTYVVEFHFIYLQWIGGQKTLTVLLLCASARTFCNAATAALLYCPDTEFMEVTTFPKLYMEAGSYLFSSLQAFPSAKFHRPIVEPYLKEAITYLYLHPDPNRQKTVLL